VGLGSPILRDMEELKRELVRRTFRWPGAARELVRAYLGSPEAKDNGPAGRIALKMLITQVATVSGNPRGACWRFARQAGLKAKGSYRGWTKEEQQKLLALIGSHSLGQVTLLMRRSPTSIRSMLHRLGASARMGQDWFSKHALAEALHVRADAVQKWIDRGWLKCRTVGSDGLQRQMIDAEDFCEFCKQHRQEIVGNRLNADRLDFVRTFVFPPSHMELLPVRGAKKEQEAFEEQMKEQAEEEAEGDSKMKMRTACPAQDREFEFDRQRRARLN
jgi:hypothetical protein